MMSSDSFEISGSLWTVFSFTLINDDYVMAPVSLVYGLSNQNISALIELKWFQCLVVFSLHELLPNLFS